MNSIAGARSMFILHAHIYRMAKLPTKRFYFFCYLSIRREKLFSIFLWIAFGHWTDASPLPVYRTVVWSNKPFYRSNIRRNVPKTIFKSIHFASLLAKNGSHAANFANRPTYFGLRFFICWPFAVSWWHAFECLIRNSCINAWRTCRRCIFTDFIFDFGWNHFNKRWTGFVLRLRRPTETKSSDLSWVHAQCSYYEDDDLWWTANWWCWCMQGYRLGYSAKANRNNHIFRASVHKVVPMNQMNICVESWILNKFASWLRNSHCARVPVRSHTFFCQM